MSLFTALATAFGGYGQGRQQRTQNQLAQQQEADYQAQTALEKQRLAQEQQRFNIEQRQIGYDPTTGLPLPTTAKYLPIPPTAKYDDIATIGARNYAIAVEANDPAGIERWGKFATVVPKGFQETAGGQYDIQGRIPLAQAQTDYWKNWRPRLKMQYDAALQKVGAQQAGAMQRAYVSANAAMARAHYSGDEREAIAIQTALNTAQTGDYNRAYQAAKDQADQQDRINIDVYNRQSEAALKAGHPLPEAPAPTPINVTTGAPSVSVTVVDPQTGQMRRVAAPTGAPPAGTPLHGAPMSFDQAKALLVKAPPGEIGPRIDLAVKQGYLSNRDAIRLRAYFGVKAGGGGF